MTTTTIPRLIPFIIGQALDLPDRTGDPSVTVALTASSTVVATAAATVTVSTAQSSVTIRAESP